MIRICGGEWRGQTLHTPSTQNTRPTSNKLREALFNSIQAYCSEARVLDLYSGSGALGFEALSRGASYVVFVEDNKLAQKALNQNIKKFSEKNLELNKRVKLLSLSVEKAISKVMISTPFDIVFADPPYGKKHEDRLLKFYPWEKLLNHAALLIIESGGLKKNEIPFLDIDLSQYKLKIIRQKQYGETYLTTFQYQGDCFEKEIIE